MEQLDGGPDGALIGIGAVLQDDAVMGFPRVGGQGLKRASVTAEQALKELCAAETYPTASVASNLMLGGFLLGLYRQVAAVASSP